MDANEAAVSYYGWPLRKLKQMNVQDINTLSSDEVQKAMEKVKNNRRTHFEFQHRRADGSIRDVDVYSSLIDLKGKKIIHSIVQDITERKRAEEQLRESEQLFRSLFEASPNAIMLLDPHDPHVSWPIVDCNEEACQMNGYTREELIGQSIDVLNLTQATDEERAAYLKQLREKDVVSLESFHRRKDGSIFPIEVSTSVVTVRNHELVLGIDRDITDRKRAEDALKENEERFRRIFEDSPIGMAMSDSSFRFIKANSSFCKMLGYTEEELQSFTFKEITHPEHLTQDVENIQKLVSGELPVYQTDKRYLRKNGDTLWGHLTLSKVLDEESKLKYYLVMLQNITERKFTEDALKESEERFRGIYQNMTIGMYRTTPDGRIVMCNPALIQMLGYESFDELAQRNLEKEGYEPKYDRKTFHDRIENEGEIHGLESSWMKKDGSLIYVSESARGIKDTTGEILYYEGTVEDITERKKAEMQIQKNLEEKEVLLKEVHHRVKNNLTVISSLLNLQARQIKTKQQALDAFKESRDRVFAMALVHEKLYQSDNFSSVDIKSYLDDMARQLVKMYRVSQNIQLKLDVNEANIDINRAIPCGLILNELITNALKYAFHKGRKGEISVSFKPYDETLYELVVSDDGVGLPADLDIENSPSLGLHLVRMLTSQLNGTWRASREKGTSFYIQFPKEAG